MLQIYDFHASLMHHIIAPDTYVGIRPFELSRSVTFTATRILVSLQKHFSVSM